MPEGAKLERRPSKKLRDLGDEAWIQFWTGRAKLRRGLFLSCQVSQDLGFAIISAPQMPVEKTAMENVRVGNWRLVTDHSYLGGSDPRVEVDRWAHQLLTRPSSTTHGLAVSRPSRCHV